MFASSESSLLIFGMSSTPTTGPGPDAGVTAVAAPAKAAAAAALADGGPLPWGFDDGFDDGAPSAVGFGRLFGAFELGAPASASCLTASALRSPSASAF